MIICSCNRISSKDTAHQSKNLIKYVKDHHLKFRCRACLRALEQSPR